jgi:hypothetical protein
MGVVALRLSSRVDRRRALLGLMVTAATLASPMRASALGVPAPEKSYAAIFLGQGGYWSSWGIPHLASQARTQHGGFEYSAVREAWKKITQKIKGGLQDRAGRILLRQHDDHLAAEISRGRSAARDFRILARPKPSHREGEDKAFRPHRLRR